MALKRMDNVGIVVEDLAATMCHLMGIDPGEEFYTPEGRPVKIVNNGRVLHELL